jgi:hypothetical protein
MKKISFAIILLTIYMNASFAQTANYDTLRVEFRKLLWKVENDYQANHDIWKRTNYNTKTYLNLYSLSIMKDTVNRLILEAQVGYYTSKETKEKINLFRENIVKLLDEYAAEKNWTKKFKESDFGKKYHRQVGFQRSYDYYDTKGRLIASIFDKQKLEMEVNLYGYPLINTEEYRISKEIENRAFDSCVKYTSQLLLAIVEADKSKKPYYKNFEKTIATERYSIRKDDIDVALIKAGFHSNTSITNGYIIYAYGFNLKDVELLSRNYENGTRVVELSSFNDITATFKEMPLIQLYIKNYNLKIYEKYVALDAKDCGILGVSNKWDEKMRIEVYKKPIQ